VLYEDHTIQAQPYRVFLCYLVFVLSFSFRFPPLSLLSFLWGAFWAIWSNVVHVRPLESGVSPPSLPHWLCDLRQAPLPS
jgi:hypothetical protein